MVEPLRCTPSDTLVVGWDFSTGSVKALAFDLNGSVVAEVRLPTDLWTEGGVSELSLLQLEGQARTATRLLARKLHREGRLGQWRVGGISATHHTAGRVDRFGNPLRRAICWNDQTLGTYHAEGLARLGGQEQARALTGGPWAVRYSLSHLVKDETTLPEAAWQGTDFIAMHGQAAAGYLTGRFDVASVSVAASTGIMDLRTNQWASGMLNALAKPEFRAHARQTLPRILIGSAPIGPLRASLALEIGLAEDSRPLLFPTLDDQAAGLIGGGATDAGQVAIILGNSAVVNSSSATLPQSGSLDAMKLNWGPYLWMRCFSNGAQFLDRLLGPKPDWAALEAAARRVPAGCNGTFVLPFILSEPSIGLPQPRYEWFPAEPSDPGVRYRAALEALAYLIALGVREHQAAGQTITRITVSGGIAQSNLMVEILASVLARPIERLVSNEGPALGAATAALADYERWARQCGGIPEPYTVADAVAQLVKFKEPVVPTPADQSAYAAGLSVFQRTLG